jgi:hypothetical protein
MQINVGVLIASNTKEDAIRKATNVLVELTAWKYSYFTNFDFIIGDNDEVNCYLLKSADGTRLLNGLRREQEYSFRQYILNLKSNLQTLILPDTDTCLYAQADTLPLYFDPFQPFMCLSRGCLVRLYNENGEAVFTDWDLEQLQKTPYQDRPSRKIFWIVSANLNY